MKSTLCTSLVNDPFGDPGMLVQFLFQKRSLLFDLGDISPLSNAELLKVSHVFVSHTHIDHFIGFDRLLRTFFGREKTLTFYGPKNFIKNVASCVTESWLAPTDDRPFVCTEKLYHGDRLSISAKSANSRCDLSLGGGGKFTGQTQPSKS